MNYDRIIIELMDRIQQLEERVAALEGSKESGQPKITTSDIRSYIGNRIAEAGDTGNEWLTLKANDIHRELKLKSRFPMVCNAMRQCMKPGDEILFEPASGYSSALEIRYHCKTAG